MKGNQNDEERNKIINECFTTLSEDGGIGPLDAIYILNILYEIICKALGNKDDCMLFLHTWLDNFASETINE